MTDNVRRVGESIWLNQAQDAMNMVTQEVYRRIKPMMNEIIKAFAAIYAAAKEAAQAIAPELHANDLRARAGSGRQVYLAWHRKCWRVRKKWRRKLAREEYEKSLVNGKR